MDVYEPPYVDKLVVGARVRFRMGERDGLGCPYCKFRLDDESLARELPETRILAIREIDAGTICVCPVCFQAGPAIEENLAFKYLIDWPHTYNGVDYRGMTVAAAELTPLD